MTVLPDHRGVILDGPPLTGRDLLIAPIDIIDALAPAHGKVGLPLSTKTTLDASPPLLLTMKRDAGHLLGTIADARQGLILSAVAVAIQRVAAR